MCIYCGLFHGLSPDRPFFLQSHLKRRTGVNRSSWSRSFRGQTGVTKLFVKDGRPLFIDYYIGEQVNILVDPAAPSHVVIDTYMERWFLITLLGSMGTLFFSWEA